MNMKICRIFIVCLVLAAAAASEGYSEETTYFAIFMGGKKVGYSTQKRVEAGGKVTTTEEIHMRVSRDGVPLNIGITETSIETVEGKPLGFEVVQDSSVE